MYIHEVHVELHLHYCICFFLTYMLALPEVSSLYINFDMHDNSTWYVWFTWVRKPDRFFSYWRMAESLDFHPAIDLVLPTGEGCLQGSHCSGAQGSRFFAARTSYELNDMYGCHLVLNDSKCHEIYWHRELTWWHLGIVQGFLEFLGSHWRNPRVSTSKIRCQFRC